MEIILASASPRRKQLLEMLGVKGLKIIPPQGEEHIAPGETPIGAVRALSRAKALEVAEACGGDGLVIAADTVVSIDDKILGKPADERNAETMLALLSGREHTVYTGVTVIKNGKILTGHEKTAVKFRKMSPEEISAYVSTGEPMDKAGAYGAQGIGSLFVEGIRGDFFNVMGLPLCRLSLMLKELDVSLL